MLCFERVVTGKLNQVLTPSSLLSTKRRLSEDSLEPDYKSSIKTHAVCEAVEFSQQQVEALDAENVALRELVKSLTEGMTRLS